MERDEVLRLAREAGLPGYPDELERFAALVAAAEREACAVTCSLMQESIGSWRKATPEDCAEAIRAR